MQKVRGLLPHCTSMTRITQINAFITACAFNVWKSDTFEFLYPGIPRPKERFQNEFNLRQKVAPFERTFFWIQIWFNYLHVVQGRLSNLSHLIHLSHSFFANWAFLHCTFSNLNFTASYPSSWKLNQTWWTFCFGLEKTERLQLNKWLKLRSLPCSDTHFLTIAIYSELNWGRISFWEGHAPPEAIPSSDWSHELPLTNHSN